MVEDGAVEMWNDSVYKASKRHAALQLFMIIDVLYYFHSDLCICVLICWLQLQWRAHHLNDLEVSRLIG